MRACARDFLRISTISLASPRLPAHNGHSHFLAFVLQSIRLAHWIEHNQLDVHFGCFLKAIGISIHHILLVIMIMIPIEYGPSYNLGLGRHTNKETPSHSNLIAKKVSTNHKRQSIFNKNTYHLVGLETLWK